MADYGNYIVDVNPFKLAGPPQWFLGRLFEFDPSLVIMPSRQGFYYRLAQRRRPNLPTKMVNDLLFRESDTKMLASRQLIPVTTILATANWDNPLLFKELAERAPWRQGGADKVNALLDQYDLTKQAKKNKEVEQNLTDRAKDGWKLYQHKTGQTVSMANKNRGRR